MTVDLNWYSSLKCSYDFSLTIVNNANKNIYLKTCTNE